MNKLDNETLDRIKRIKKRIKKRRGRGEPSIFKAALTIGLSFSFLGAAFPMLILSGPRYDGVLNPGASFAMFPIFAGGIFICVFLVPLLIVYLAESKRTGNYWIWFFVSVILLFPVFQIVCLIILLSIRKHERDA